MDIDRVPDDEENDDATTSKASKSTRLEFIWMTGLFVSYLLDFLCLLQLHGTLLCSRTMKRSTAEGKEEEGQGTERERA